MSDSNQVETSREVGRCLLLAGARYLVSPLCSSLSCSDGRRGYTSAPLGLIPSAARAPADSTVYISRTTTHPHCPPLGFAYQTQPFALQSTILCRTARMASGTGDNAIDLRSLEAVSEYNKNLMCLVCHCPFITPTRLRCDHIFCRSCLDDCIKSSSDMNQFTQPSEFLCPTCRTPTNATYTTVPRLVVAMCDDILVKCPYHAEGCTETIQRGHAQVHVDKYCEYRWMPCPDAQCEKKIRKKDLGSEDRCLHTLVDCGQCGESVMELDFEVCTCHCSVNTR